jgi:hypothetical protein
VALPPFSQTSAFRSLAASPLPRLAHFLGVSAFLFLIIIRQAQPLAGGALPSLIQLGRLSQPSAIRSWVSSNTPQLSAIGTSPASLGSTPSQRQAKCTTWSSVVAATMQWIDENQPSEWRKGSTLFGHADARESSAGVRPQNASCKSYWQFSLVQLPWRRGLMKAMSPPRQGNDSEARSMPLAGARYVSSYLRVESSK